MGEKRGNFISLRNRNLTAMKVNYRLSNKVQLVDGIECCEVLARIHVGTVDIYAKTHVLVPSYYLDTNKNKRPTWKNGMPYYSSRTTSSEYHKTIERMVNDATERLNKINEIAQERFSQDCSGSWLQDVIDGLTSSSRKSSNKPSKSRTANAITKGGPKTLVDAFRLFVASNNLTISDGMRRQYKTLLKHITEYDATRTRRMTLDNISPEDIKDFERFLIEEYGNSQNTASRRLRWLRIFIRWANGLNREDPIEPMTSNNPFDRMKIATEVYGTPFYLTIDERNRLANCELPERLSIQRDIFVFQCCIGCRVSDLYSLTRKNIVDGAVEYVAKKTKGERPETIRVPLNSEAKRILQLYEGKLEGDKILPFVNSVQYNIDIKEMLRIAGIDRIVTIMKDGSDERHPIWEVASSHMARRTFIGNLYKQVKDPNLIGKLSGHSEGSRAFARYRDIDEDMAKELVAMLE